MRKRPLLQLCVLFVSFLLLNYQKSFAQEVYANQVLDSSSDFQNAYRAIDNNSTNYAYVSNAITVLSTSYLKVRFPQSGKAGDVINVRVQGTGSLLSVGLLNGATVKLYDSLGNLVKTGTGATLLDLSLLTSGTNIYTIRFYTNPSDTFKIKDVRVEFSNLLTANLLSQFRVYNVSYQIPCPPVYATQVQAYSTGGLLTSNVSNPNNAVDANPNNVATMTIPLNLLSLLPDAYIDLKFAQHGRGGDFVGFTIGQASSLLSLSLLQNLEVKVYDDAGTLRQTKAGFNLLELKLLSGTTNRYSIGFMSTAGNYRIARLRLTMKPVLGLLQNLNVYNAFHYSVIKPPVTVDISGPTTFCIGGSVTLTANDPYGATSYYWNTGATTQSITVSQSGTYFVEIVDSLSCTRQSMLVEVIVLPNLNVKIVGDTVLCAGASGSLSTEETYDNYLWSTGATTSSIALSTPGKYYVGVKLGGNCTGSDTVVVQSNTLEVIPTITATTCSGSTNGAISLNVNGGSGKYKYKWSNGTTTNAISSLKAGLYVCEIEDSTYGCKINRAFTVPSNNTLSLRSTVINTSTCDSSDGSVTLAVIGGSGTYSYLWSNGATTANLSNVGAGVYRVNVTDATGSCIASDTVVVSNTGNTLAITPVVINASGCNSNTGIATLTILGGSGLYSYTWSNGATTNPATGLKPGRYYVSIKDNLTNCSGSVVVNVGNAAALNLSGTATPAACNSTNGSINLTVTGGLGAYTYSWSNGATTQDISGLRAGTYIITVTNATSGCVAEKVFTVGESSSATATLNVTQPSCSSNSNGEIAINVTGVNKYRYKWSNGSTTKDQINLKPGTYTVVITDTVTNCTNTLNAVIAPKSQVEVTASPKPNTACVNAANGAITTSVMGGTAPYTYSWSNSGTTANINNLNAGNYTLNISDAVGCSSSISVPVKTDSSKLLKVSVVSILGASCNTSLTGSAVISVTGGQLPYTFSWSNGSLLQNLLNVKAGNYTLTVTDALGCTATIGVTIGINNSNPIHVVVDSTKAAGCSGSAIGGIYVSVTGGATPYSYLWSNGANTQDLTNVAAGTYRLTVTDNGGCTDTLTENVPVQSTSGLVVTLDSVRTSSCPVSMDGGIFISVAGGTAPYNYIWSNGATTQDITGINPGSYTVTATDVNGCPGQLTAIVGVNPTSAIVVTIDSTKGAGCANGNTAAIYITPSGGSTPYAYKWSNNATTQDLENIIPGSYSVIVTDSKGCTANKTAQAVIDNTTTVRATIDSTVGAGCAGSNSGNVYVQSSRGKAPYTYSWSTGATTEDLLNLPPGSYTLTISDASGCSSMLNASISIDPAKQIVLTVDSTLGASCNMGTNAKIYVSTSGGKAPYQYMWSNGSNSEDLTNVQQGSYTLFVTDANNCNAQTSASVGTDATRNIQIATSSITDAGCSGSASGAINITVTGGQPPYSYNWSNGAKTQNISNVAPGSYTVTVTDAAGCSNQFSANVSINSTNAINIAATTVTDAKCDNSLSGAIDITVTKGVPPYVYKWSNGAVSEDITYIASGSYVVTVSDAIGCSAQLSVNVGISNPNPLDVVVDHIVGVGCADTTSGKVYVNTLGGDAPYSYIWSNGNTAEDLINVPIGSYMLDATDNSGCKDMLSANVEKAAPFVVSADIQNVKCFGQANGSISINVAGGSGMYQYRWENGGTAKVVADLAVGTYSVDIMDADSKCSQSDSFTITQPAVLAATAKVTNDTCTDIADGAIEISVTGGTPPYTYAWTNGSQESMLTGLVAGAYTTTITDANGCTTTADGNVATSDCNFNIVVHNVITPNGDGANDTWIIEGIEFYPNTVLMVFDKWGDKVFESKNYNGKWSANDVPDGTYFYVLKLNTANKIGGKNEFTGSLLIQR
ncbi:MAG: T9SS type B sorting domain-containing protein [Sphingobacteriales bacterium]|nr:MAG: T9SS type B sorting domain-containing protein [Sphingobacteriales bacterium]